MVARWLAAGVVGVAAAVAAGQPAPADRPTELPPLLPVPPQGTPAPAARPGGPKAEYDHGYLYLPERAPEPARPTVEVGVPRGDSWVMPTLELGWSRSADLPAVVRAGAPGGPAVFGGTKLIAPFRPGLGLSLGRWFTQDHSYGVEGSVYFLEQDGSRETLAGDGRVPLFLPTAGGTAFPLAGPGVGAGAVTATYSTRYASADANVRQMLYLGPQARFELLTGYRYAHLGEKLSLDIDRVGVGGDLFRSRDRFDVGNNFHGGELGLSAETRVDGWYVSATGKVAVGALFTTADADGATLAGGGVSPFGFYARPAVGGRRAETRFAVLPTLALSAGRKVTDHSRLFLGYTFQYLSNITRPGDVLDPAPDAFGTGAGTARGDSRSDFWVQTLTLGLEVRY